MANEAVVLPEDFDEPDGQYPFDPEGLDIGDDVLPEVIEKAFGVLRDDRRYGLSLLRAGAFVESYFEKQGRTVTTWSRGDRLHICTDSEAVEANVDRGKKALRALRKGQMKLSGVDTRELTQAESNNHMRALTAFAALNAFARHKRPLLE